MAKLEQPVDHLVEYEDFAEIGQNLGVKYYVRAARNRRFPAFIRIGHNSPRWRRDQVEAWFAALHAPIQLHDGDDHID